MNDIVAWRGIITTVDWMLKIFIFFAFASEMGRSIWYVVWDVLRINYVSDSGLRLNFETVVSAEDKVTYCMDAAIATCVTCSVVCVCVGQSGEPCKNGWTNRDAISDGVD